MSTIEIIGKIESLKEWEALQEEAAAMVESIKDEIKRHMEAVGTETLEAGQYIARFTTVQSSRFDTKRFKNEIGDLTAIREERNAAMKKSSQLIVLTILLIISAVAPLVAGILFFICQATGLTNIEL